MQWESQDWPPWAQLVPQASVLVLVPDNMIPFFKNRLLGEKSWKAVSSGWAFHLQLQHRLTLDLLSQDFNLIWS